MTFFLGRREYTFLFSGHFSQASPSHLSSYILPFRRFFSKITRSTNNSPSNPTITHPSHLLQPRAATARVEAKLPPTSEPRAPRSAGSEPLHVLRSGRPVRRHCAPLWPRVPRELTGSAATPRVDVSSGRPSHVGAPPAGSRCNVLLKNVPTFFKMLEYFKNISQHFH
jgi:hypothetical protein